MALQDSGTVFLATLENVALPGRKPVFKLTKYAKYYFEARTVGYARQYMARGVNQQIDLIIRTNPAKANVGDYAILGNGEQYKIDNIQHILEDTTGLKKTDFTLHRLEEFYELSE